MNTSAISSFAPEVRRQLLEAVERKLDFVLTGDTADLRAASAQVERLRAQAQAGRPQLIEGVSYTWFNRLAALRFLDARGWHPFRVRVLTPASPRETQPEILRLVRNGVLPEELKPYVDPGRLNDLLDGRLPSFDPQGEVYRHLVLAACRFYHALLPFLFERLDDETELLLPDDLLTEHSVAQGFRTEITDEDCTEVEVLGWLYQFYISEKKDQVMARKTAVASEDIPAVTQLFTPHWIVRYLVENSLGRLWLRSRPASALRASMPYYVEDPDGQVSAESLTVSRPEEIRVLDPACGSGHMLTYAFDLLFQIYEEEGHAPSEIPEKILTYNLYGLEICPRATQLAQFALLAKAREKSRTAFREAVQPQVMCLQDVTFSPDELRSWRDASGLASLFTDKALKQLHQFRENTSTFGSLIQPVLDADEIGTLKNAIARAPEPADLLLQETQRKVLLTFDQAEMLTRRYHVVVTNPPYMGFQGFCSALRLLARAEYPSSKSDLFSMFIERCRRVVTPSGLLGLMTPFTWMFLSSYGGIRARMISEATIVTLVRPEYHSFFDSAFVPICCFVIWEGQAPGFRGCYVDLNRFTGAERQGPKALEALRDADCSWRYAAQASEFAKIPGSPIAYWVPNRAIACFEECASLASVASPRQGLITGDNARFLRYWHEVGIGRVGLSCGDAAEAARSRRRWFPHQKGGNFRKWYGNHEYVVDWESDGERIRGFVDDNGRQRSRPQNTKYYFKPAVTWTALTVASFNGRLCRGGFVYDAKGPLLHSAEESLLPVFAGYLNSAVANYFLKLLAPTMDYNQGPVGRLPFRMPNEDATVGIQSLVAVAENLARTDWDNFETSWDFHDLPLLRPDLRGPTLEASWRSWEAYLQANIAHMQELETENNRLWIEAYGLEDELTAELPEEEITLARPERRKDVVAFLSYAVGCMMGRYSLDQPGLVLADAGGTLEDYLAKVGVARGKLNFTPDEDGIIPVLGAEWFDDDIVARTRTFLKATLGQDGLDENVHFIEESLGKDLRKYFLSDFYKDHLQTYKKRPIYWMFQSPKKGFQCLIYLHRYTRDTPHRVLNRYLREYLAKMRYRQEHLERDLASESTSPRDKTRARKESDELKRTVRECEGWERDVLLPLTQRQIDLDLDDGVKVNYLKLGQALAPIPGLARKEE